MIDLTVVKNGETIDLSSIDKYLFVIDTYSQTPRIIFDKKNFNLLSKLIMIFLYNSANISSILASDTIEAILSFEKDNSGINDIKIVRNNQELIYSDGKITHNFQEEGNGSLKDLIDFISFTSYRKLSNKNSLFSHYLNTDCKIIYKNIVYVDLYEFLETFKIPYKYS